MTIHRYTEGEEHRMDRAEDAYQRFLMGEAAPIPRRIEWQPWAMATDEQHARRWLETHDEDGRDYDYSSMGEGWYGDDE